ncbi:MAG: hypothetical protein NDI61_11785 [Bdellovibrionaceae bacterium]|nr:hypothetical protein [Pseudobdellovibrionaceae bacterium]
MKSSSSTNGPTPSQAQKWTSERAFAEGLLALSGLCAFFFIVSLPWSLRTLGACVWLTMCAFILLVLPAMFVRHLMREAIAPRGEKDPYRLLWIGGLAFACLSMQFTSAMAFESLFGMNFAVRSARVRAACVKDQYSSVECQRAMRLCGKSCVPVLEAAILKETSDDLKSEKRQPAMTSGASNGPADSAKPVVRPVSKPLEKPVTPSVEKAAPKPAVKSPAKPAPKPAPKSVKKPIKK